jgi:acetyltransferase-like isoleucine patch superfamily enzyme
LREMAKRVVHAGLPMPAFIRPLVRAAYQAGVAVVEGSVFIRKLLWVEPVLRAVCDHVGHGLRAECLPYMRGRGLLRFGNRVNLSGRSCFYFLHGMTELPRIEIGDQTFIGNGCTFSAGRAIQVGSHCLISALVRIHDNDGHPLDPARRRRGEPIRSEETAAVVLGDNVWVGAGATILKGVQIGNDAVIGTGAVVTSDIPAGAVVAGNPARIVKQLD